MRASCPVDRIAVRGRKAGSAVVQCRHGHGLLAIWAVGVGCRAVTGRRRLPGVVARLPKTRVALEYAERHHAGQRRSFDGAAFIEHPLEVGWLLYRAGAPDQVIAAGVLHDVLEKTSVSVAQLRRSFGSPVANLVRAVSEDERIVGYGQRKAALRQQAASAGPEALMIFTADKVSKVHELRAAISMARRRHERVDKSLVRPRRLAHYRNCLGMLDERFGDAPLVELLRAELAGLSDDLKAAAELSVAA